ncbi:RNA polymerase sigma-70 factor [Cellulophaga lytica]|nr:RNA polymerase sigma-70 factor [Cellulophaga lytica]
MLVNQKQFNEQLLLKEVYKGNINAYETIFNTYWKRLYLYAFKVYEDESLCEDIVQEVFINFWERRESLNVNKLENYLFKSVKYKMANAIRDLKFTNIHLSKLLDLPSDSSQENTVEYKELQQEINSVIATLPDKCKKVFIMSRFDDLTNAEIAAELNLSIRTVETHISNAIKHLKNNLSTTSLYASIILMLT